MSTKPDCEGNVGKWTLAIAFRPCQCCLTIFIHGPAWDSSICSDILTSIRCGYQSSDGRNPLQQLRHSSLKVLGVCEAEHWMTSKRCTQPTVEHIRAMNANRYDWLVGIKSIIHFCTHTHTHIHRRRFISTLGGVVPFPSSSHPTSFSHFFPPLFSPIPFPPKIQLGGM